MRRSALVAQVAAGVALLVLAGCGDDDGGGAGGPFTEVPGLSLTGVYDCSLAWGDCDNDGDLDLAVAGWTGSARITKVYENDGAGGFAEFPGLSLTGVCYCSLAWGDCDNDGDLDLAVAGATGGFNVITKVYENDGTGGFAEFPALSLTGVEYCSLAWGDCDNDGDLDLAVAGRNDVGFVITRVYENDGAGGFAEFPGLNLTGVEDCSLAWGDCDSDGDLDLAVAGWTGSASITKVYENDGAGGFAEFPGLSLTGVEACSLAWGDCDNDGDLDLAVAGYAAGVDITTIYENDGAGGFAEFPGLSLTGVRFCSLAWGDCDNDGDLDLAVAGWVGPATARISKVYENDGAGGFAEFPGLSLTGVSDCSLAWGDCDNDGDLDLAVAGLLWAALITTVYENDGTLPNVPPGQVTGLSTFTGGGETVLMWSEGSDDETPSGGLSYNLRLVDTASGLDVFPAMGAASGWRRVPSLGPVRPGPSYAWHALSLPTGDYEFRVQAIDSGFEGGPWSAPVPFAVP